MAAAYILTLLAIAGIIAGIYIGQSRTPSSELAAAGGGLLFGIALFWLIPEVAEISGWIGALGLALAACIVLALLDRLLRHTGHSPSEIVIGPLLAATAVHSFLDGWSVRVLSAQPVTNVAVPLGLALHKVPEGLALGLITRRSMASISKAFLASSAVEVLTLIGALAEPQADRSGVAAFGSWWTAVVVAVIAGSFLFLSFHALLPNRRKTGVVSAFLAAFLFVAGAAFVQRKITSS